MTARLLLNPFLTIPLLFQLRNFPLSACCSTTHAHTHTHDMISAIFTHKLIRRRGVVKGHRECLAGFNSTTTCRPTRDHFSLSHWIVCAFLVLYLSRKESYLFQIWACYISCKSLFYCPLWTRNSDSTNPPVLLPVYICCSKHWVK